MQSNTNVLNIVWDRNLKEFFILDDNHNMVKETLQLTKENSLHNIMIDLVNDDAIDPTLVNSNVDDVYMFLIEKIYASKNLSDHNIHKFIGPLNYKTKVKVITAFNKFLHTTLSKRLHSEVIIQYD